MTTKQFRRSVAVDTPDFIEEKDERIIELAFSSEAPYTRYYMNQDGEQVELKEILVHDESAVDLSVLNETNASLLFNHNLDLHIGKIVPGSARIDEDRVGRCWICPYISRHLLSLNPLQARCRRYSRGER